MLEDSPAEDKGLLTFYLGEAYRRRGLGDDKVKAAAYYAQAITLPDAPIAAWREHGYALLRAGGGDAARTSLILCHRSPAMLWRHYKGLATKADAERYFAISPPTV